MRWRSEDSACSEKPALSFSDCWREDSRGRYSVPPRGPYDNPGASRGSYAWLADMCGPPPEVNQRDIDKAHPPAWRWGDSLEGLATGTVIALGAYPGSAMLTQGTVDEVWSLANGIERIMATFQRAGTRFTHTIVAQTATAPAELPVAPADRLLTFAFEGEAHTFRTTAVRTERNLMLTFFAARLR